MKFLITCAGRRDELISYFKKLDAVTEVHTCDIDIYAPAQTQSDYFHIVPSVFEENYIESILTLCESNKIDVIFSINDLELQKISKNKDKFLQIGTFPLISSPEVIEICCDKKLTNDFLNENNFKTPQSFSSKDTIDKDIFPLIIKPRFGTASIGVELAYSLEEFNVLYSYCKLQVEKSALNNLIGGTDILIQEKIEGKEYAVDIINDLQGNYVGSVIKRKISIRGGDAAVVETEKNDIIERECKALSMVLKHIGNLDVDIILNENGVYFVDLNPRFGGAYPFSYHSGVNLPEIIVNSLLGKGLPSKLDYKEGIITMRTEKYMKR